MHTLWPPPPSAKEEFEEICSRELLTERAAEIRKTISVKGTLSFRQDDVL